MEKTSINQMTEPHMGSHSAQSSQIPARQSMANTALQQAYDQRKLRSRCHKHGADFFQENHLLTDLDD